MLLLHRLPTKTYGNMWGFPTGKLWLGEDADTGMRRELEEETGICEVPRFFQSIFVHPADESRPQFTYHLYRLRLSKRPLIRLDSSEHDAHCWISTNALESLELVPDLAACIELLTNSRVPTV